MIRFLRKLFRTKILNKIVTQFVFSHVFLAVLSIALVGFFLLSEINSFITQSVKNNQLEVARRSASEIYYFVSNTLNNLSFATKFRDVYLMQSIDQQVVLDEMQTNNKEIYRKIFVTDTTGTIVSTTEFGAVGLIDEDFPYLDDQPLGSPYISPVNIIDDRPVITVSTPIIQYDRFVGNLSAEIDVGFIWDLVDSLSKKIPGGQVYIISDNGTLIAHPTLSYVYNNENLASFAFVQNLLDNNEGTDTYEDLLANGETMICAYTPVKELKWGIVVAQTQSVAYSVYRDILQKWILIIAGSIVIALVLGIIITRNLVQPLKKLVEGVQRVSEGSSPGTIEIPHTEELATLAREFNHMTENLESVQKKLQMAERLATMSKFASVVAHEIRNPFNSVVINLQVLKRDIRKKEPPDRLEQHMDVIDSEIRRIDDLIQNYLSFTKPREFDPHDTDLHILLDEIILAQHARAEKQSVRIERETDHDSLIIPADEDQLKQAFLNIMLNSFQAMPKGGSLKIAVLADHNGGGDCDGTVKIVFEDSGIGIEPDNLPKVFDFFYTSKTTGTGLGLAVTQQIIEAHHGTINISSTPDHGTAVTVLLPKE